MKLELGRKQTWSAELFSRVFMLKIHYPTDSGGLLVCWCAPLTWRQVMESVRCSAPKRTYTLLAMYAAPMLFCLACYSNNLCISEQGTWLLHFCLTVPEPPAMAMSCPEGCRPVRVCSFVLHLQEGVMLECHQSFYGLNFEWQKGSNTDLVKAEVFL